jgi:hypothetical protein
MVCPPPVPDHPVSESANEATSPTALGSAVWVKCTGTRRQALSFLVMNDCGRPNRRCNHTRANNMGVAEGQNARSSDYRQSTRLTRTELTRIFSTAHRSSGFIVLGLVLFGIDGWISRFKPKASPSPQQEPKNETSAEANELLIRRDNLRCPSRGLQAR